MNEESGPSAHPRCVTLRARGRSPPSLRSQSVRYRTTSLAFVLEMLAPSGPSAEMMRDWFSSTSRSSARSRTPPATATRTSARTSPVSTSTRSHAIHGAVAVTV